MMHNSRFEPGVSEKLGAYVYFLRDPSEKKNQGIFYVGKGRGRRAESHLAAARKLSNSEYIRRQYPMLEKIREIGADNVQIHILIHGLRDDLEAFNVESAAIDLLGLEHLHNRVRGHDSTKRGIASLRQLNARLGAKPVTSGDLGDDRIVFIRVARTFQPTGDQETLYEAVRKWWVIADKRRQLGNPSAPEWAAAVFGGVVYGVYRIEKWRKKQTRDARDRDRWGFTGTRDLKMERRLLNKDVSALLPPGAQWPLAFVNCG